MFEVTPSDYSPPGRRVHAGADPPGVRLQQDHLRRRQGRRDRPDDRHRRCLRRPEHPGRPERLRRPVRPARARRSPGSTRPAGRAYPATDSTGGWELEESLDVEWAHAIAPGAKILLVEANSPNDTRPARGRRLRGGARQRRLDELGRRRVLGRDLDLRQPLQPRGRGVRGLLGRQRRPDLLAGRLAERPGRRRHGAHPRRGQRLRRARAGWSGSGGGPSAYEAQPAYQSGVVTQTTTAGQPRRRLRRRPVHRVRRLRLVPLQRHRSTAGSRSAAPAPGARSGRRCSRSPTRAAPSNGQPPLDSTSPQEVMTTLYKNATAGDFHDVTTGTSTGSPNYSAGAGYDYVTGLGSPMADLVVQRSRRHGVTTRDRSPGRHRAPTTDVAGASFSVTVTARNSERRDRRRLHRHGPLHQQRRPGRPARELHVHRRRRRDRTPSPSRSRRPAPSRSPRPTRRRRPSPAPSRGSPSARPRPASSSSPACPRPRRPARPSRSP